MTGQERKLRLASIRRAAESIRRIAYAQGLDREIREMEACIRADERGHLRFGRALLGKRPARKLTMPDVVDVFTVRTVLEYLYARRAPRADEMLGMRRDYQIGAMLAWYRGRRDDGGMRGALRKEFGPRMARHLMERADYSRLQGNE